MVDNEDTDRQESSGPNYPSVILVVLALAMECVYLGVLSLHDLKKNVVQFIPLMLLQGVLYVVAVYIAQKASPRRGQLMMIALAALAFRLTLLPLYPSLSDDLYRYRWEGRAQRAGYNPYLARPDDPALAGLLEREHPAVSGPEHGTLYGPVIEEISWVSSALFRNVIAAKIPYLLCDVGVILLLFALLPQMGISPMLAIVYAWSPLVVVEFAASGHNDSVPIFAFVLALYFYKVKSKRLSIASLSLSALSKLYAAFLFPIFLMRTAWRWIWIPAFLAVITFLPYGAGWRGLLGTVSGYGEVWKNNASLFRIIRLAAGTDSRAEILFLIVLALVIVFCMARKLCVERSSYLIIATILLVSPNVFPWYLTWIVPLLCIFLEPGWLLLTVTAFLSYHVLIPYSTTGLWREDWRFVVLEYTPFYAVLVAGYVLRRFRKVQVATKPLPAEPAAL